MKKKVLSALLVAVLAVSMLAGCGDGGKTADAPVEGADTEADKPAEATAAEEGTEAAGGAHKMVLIGSQSGGTFWQPIEDAYRAELAAIGWTGDYWAPANAENPDADVLQLCETALSQDYDVIAAVMNDNNIFDDFRTRAAEKGVTVLGFNCNPGEDLVPAYVGIASDASGRQQGEKIAEYIKDWGITEVNYVTMCVSSDIASQQLMIESALAAIQEACPDVTLNHVGDTECDGNPANTQSQLNAMYVTHPDINVLISADSYSTIGAASFIEENGMDASSEGKQIIIIGMALDAESFERVQNGNWTATSSVDTEWMGRQIVDVADAIANGGEYEYANNPGKIFVANQEEIDAYCAEHGIDM